MQVGLPSNSSGHRLVTYMLGENKEAIPHPLYPLQYLQQTNRRAYGASLGEAQQGLPLRTAAAYLFRHLCLPSLLSGLDHLRNERKIISGGDGLNASQCKKVDKLQIC